MKSNRRKFISSAVVGGLAATGVPFSSLGADLKSAGSMPTDLQTRYDYLDEVVKRPVFRKELFSSPVILETIELLRDRNNFLVRVRSKEGAVGIAAGHGSQNSKSWPAFEGIMTRFLGKDARDLDKLVPGDSGKSGGIPFNSQVAILEFAILDMMGNLIKKPAGELIGKIVNPMISVYQGSRVVELRQLPPEESLEIVKKDLLESKAKAIKMRAGGGGILDGDNAPGRTEKLLKMARETFGDQMVLGCDGNGNYTRKGGIRMGKVLEEYNYSWWEEMVPFGQYDDLKHVKDGLRIPIFTGESESHISTFRWLIANDACDVVQPDQLYFGGMIRSMKVARMAEVFGKTIVPHITQYGLGYLYMLHFISACPNAGKYQEFDLFSTRDANGNNIPIVYKSGDPITSYDGVLKVPTGSGLGITIDPEYVKKHKALKNW
ncbi:mandelate racemase/muconate lactonizing enzyme family protein [Larkinella sp. GY13]|uniref:mandelate racemase/muconate lactonizing enzyme family protein n=1 Tax=Larkinella sp. GY13 TaxID=3453720 RepID=UPI003EEB0EAA